MDSRVGLGPHRLGLPVRIETYFHSFVEFVRDERSVYVFAISFASISRFDGCRSLPCLWQHPLIQGWYSLVSPELRTENDVRLFGMYLTIVLIPGDVYLPAIYHTIACGQRFTECLVTQE